MTDEHASYQHLGHDFARHASVTHSQDEYVRYTNAVMFPSGKPYTIQTNTVEGYFSVFKRGMKGVINIARKSIFTATLRNSISAIQIGRGSA
jgi:hypothetical protein